MASSIIKTAVTGQLKTERIGNFLVLDLGAHKVYGVPTSLTRKIWAARDFVEHSETPRSVDSRAAVDRLQPPENQSHDTRGFRGNRDRSL
jgi:hypothetical protein